MPIIQEFDKNKKSKHYKGYGFHREAWQSHTSSKAFYESDSDDYDNDDFYGKRGGYIDIASIIKNKGQFVNDNKDTIQSVSSTVGKVIDTTGKILDTVKSSNELKKMEEVKKIRASKKFTPEQESTMIGAGFARFSSSKTN